MKKVIYTLVALFFTLVAGAQAPKFSIEVSTDTVLLGNYFELKYTIENGSSNTFEAPDLSKFVVLGGPNTATSMRIINGEVSQSASYGYILQPQDLGIYTVPPAYVTINEEVLETPPVDILVAPNPDGIVQQPDGTGKRFDQLIPSVPQSPAKPKRPRKKM